MFTDPKWEFSLRLLSHPLIQGTLFDIVTFLGALAIIIVKEFAAAGRAAGSPRPANTTTLSVQRRAGAGITGTTRIARTGTGGGSGRVPSSRGGSAAASVVGRFGRSSRDDGGLSNRAGCTAHQGRAWNFVGLGTGVYIEKNARVGLSHEGLAECAGGQRGAAASNLKVEAVRVVLSTVGITARVKGNYLVAENIMAGLDASGDLGSPLKPILEQNIIGPEARDSVIDASSFGDLEELEGRLVDEVAAVVGARSEIVNDGAMMGFGPCAPLEGDGISCLNRRIPPGVFTTPFADHIGITEVGGLDEAIVRVGRTPADHNGGRIHVRIAVHIVARVRNFVDDDIIDVTVSGNTNSSRKGGGGGGGGGSDPAHREIYESDTLRNE